jgi:hypothetical protein
LWALGLRATITAAPHGQWAWLGSGRVRDDRGIEEGAALLGFGGALREEAPLVLRRHPGVTLELPHMRLADIEGGLRHERAPPCAVLREGGPLGDRAVVGPMISVLQRRNSCVIGPC